MKKLFSLFITIAFIGIFFAACDIFSSDDEEKDNPPVELTTYNQDDLVGSGTQGDPYIIHNGYLVKGIMDNTVNVYFYFDITSNTTYKYTLSNMKDDSNNYVNYSLFSFRDLACEFSMGMSDLAFVDDVINVYDVDNNYELAIIEVRNIDGLTGTFDLSIQNQDK